MYRYSLGCAPFGKYREPSVVHQGSQLSKCCVVALITVLGAPLHPCYAQEDLVDLSPIVAPGGTPDPGCFTIGESVTVTVQMGPAQRAINGGQFTVDYDPNCLTLASIVQAGAVIPGNPYVLQIAELIDPVAGTAFFSVSVPLGGEGVPGDAALAVMNYFKQGNCSACLLCIDVEDSILMDDLGTPVPVNPSCSTPIRTGGDLTLSVPESVVEDIVCASQATVTWSPPFATTSCGSAGLVCTGEHTELGTVWDQEVVMGGGDFPFGTSNFCCTASNDCGETLDACWSVTVQELPCTDGIGCTVDTCLAGSCGSYPDDNNCDDGFYCNGVEFCDPVLGCQLVDVPDCDDGVACTVDTCNEIDDACVNVADDGLCDNGDFCDGTETCNAVLGCQAGTQPNCDDGVDCTVDSCDELNDQCVNSQNNESCNDDVDCTVDLCHSLIGCMNVLDHGYCDNGDFCDGIETCDSVNDCQVGSPPNCDDGVACTVDTCNEIDDACVNVADDSLCDNGDFCDGIETCDSVNDCQVGSPPNCDDYVGCTRDVCDSIDGCLNLPIHFRCYNEVFCDGQEVCDLLNDCQPGTLPDCDDGVPCTVDSCDMASDVCVHVPDDTFCDNGDFCDGSEVCEAQIGCQAGTPRSCDAPDAGDDVCRGGSNDGGSCAIDADCPSGVCGNKNRYVTIKPPASMIAGGDALSIRVTLVDIHNALGFDDREGEVWWAGPSQVLPNSPNPDLVGAPLVCETSPSNAESWTFTYVHLFGAPLVPNSLYEVRMCDVTGSSCADPLYVGTGKWGDVVTPYGGGSQPNFGDISSVVDKFRGTVASAPDMPRSDLVGLGNPGDPNSANQDVNFGDISADVDAFRGFTYPFTVPACP